MNSQIQLTEDDARVIACFLDEHYPDHTRSVEDLTMETLLSVDQVEESLNKLKGVFFVEGDSELDDPESSIELEVTWKFDPELMNQPAVKIDKSERLSVVYAPEDYSQPPP